MSAANCTAYPPLQANPDISGIGVRWISEIGYVSLFCCIAKCTLDHRQKKARGKRALRIERWSFAFEKAIIAFSDQQLVTGVSVVVGGLQQLEWGLPVYYFQQVANLAWFSTITHILTLTILREKMQTKSSALSKTIRIVLMGCLVVLLACVIAPLGYLSSAYGTYGFQASEDSPVQGPIPMEFPAWCLYNPSVTWADENGQPMVHVGTYGYNLSYIIITIGIIFYGYTSRVALLFPGFVSRSVLRIPSGQPWIWFETKLAGIQAFRHPRSSRASGFFRCIAGVGYAFLYSIYILVVSGKHVYGSKTWELLWLTLALIWGTLRIWGGEWYDGNYDGDTYSGVFSQQDIWGFGQVVVLVLLALPFLSFAEGYLDFTEETASLGRVDPTNAMSKISAPLRLSSHETESQHEIKTKPWYRSLLVLWGLMSFMVGAYALTNVAQGNGADWSPVNQFTAGISNAIGVSDLWKIFPFIMAVDIGIAWLFILIMLLEWRFLSNKTGSVILCTFFIMISGGHVWAGVWMDFYGLSF
ncbi:uncharacterized protein PAC_16480 [Phialocephala subalpina]|uniref:Uncharacterized protein n=1 Tax=Phialocephala subalpina TaxID=576137 RepID=A0A1L7XNG8_9HELO|nr:uncharacterized protein PAC_16480 [Phialocephala subalpina]